MSEKDKMDRLKLEDVVGESEEFNSFMSDVRDFPFQKDFKREGDFENPQETGDFAIRFRGKKATDTVDELAKLWNKSRLEVIHLAIGLLYKVSKHKQENNDELAFLNKESGVLTFIELT